MRFTFRADWLGSGRRTPAVDIAAALDDVVAPGGGHLPVHLGGGTSNLGSTDLVALSIENKAPGSGYCSDQGKGWC